VYQEGKLAFISAGVQFRIAIAIVCWLVLPYMLGVCDWIIYVLLVFITLQFPYPHTSCIDFLALLKPNHYANQNLARSSDF
jgi:fatty acid desaturase